MAPCTHNGVIRLFTLISKILPRSLRSLDLTSLLLWSFAKNVSEYHLVYTRINNHAATWPMLPNNNPLTRVTFFKISC